MARMLASLFGLVSILQLLGLLDRASALIERGGFRAVLRFVGLQLPGLVAETIPLAVLVGATLTFLHLAGTLEMVAMRSCGQSLLQTLRALAPACLLLAAAQFGLQAEVVPRTERAFADWWFRTAPTLANEPAPAPLWFRSGNDVASVGRVSPDGTRLENLTVLQRAPDGRLAAWLRAGHATFHDHRWTLHDLKLARPGGGEMAPADALDWPHGPAPGNMVELARPVDSATLSHLAAIIGGERVGSRSKPFYWTLLNRLAAGLFDPILMVLLALPAALTPARSGNGLPGLTGVSLGLGYLVCAGLLTALGNAGWLPPPAAGWGATVAFAAVGVSRMVRGEEA